MVKTLAQLRTHGSIARAGLSAAATPRAFDGAGGQAANLQLDPVAFAAESLDLLDDPDFDPAKYRAERARERLPSAPQSRALVLQPPPEEDPIAELDWFVPENQQGDEGDPRWRIKGSPVVVVAAMKCFSGAISRSRGSVSFPAWEYNFEELVILRHRYPVSLTDAARSEWQRQFAQARERHGAQTRAAYHPQSFKGTLLPFQAEGVDFMVRSRKCLNADDMGLGKTVQAFAFLEAVQQWPALIIAQAHVQRHWEKKIEEFMDAKQADAASLLGGNSLRWVTLEGAKASALPEADVYIVHYLVLWAWADLLNARGMKTVVFDECQELRNPGTRKHEACIKLARYAVNAVGLSGTPIYNHGEEIYNVSHGINSGCLGTKVDFKEAWSTPQGRVLEPDVLGQYLRDRKLMIRRHKDQVQSQLPSKRRVVEPISGDAEVFAELVQKAVQLAKDAVDVKSPFDRARMEAEAMRQTRQATAVAKIPAIVAFLRALLDAGEPTLVFAHHHAVYDAILAGLEEFQPAAVTGRESRAQKEDALNRFIEGGTNCCLISLRAATGIDGLQKRARVVVFAELDWSPAVHAQAEDRAHRMGQAESVIVYYLVTDLGTDPFIMATLGEKAFQFTGLMHDRPETEDDKRLAKDTAREHMAGVMEMLRRVKT